MIAIAKKIVKFKGLHVTSEPGRVNWIEFNAPVAAEQTAAVENVITFGFVGLETFTGILLAVLLIFLNVEKNIGREQAEIKARREGK